MRLVYVTVSELRVPAGAAELGLYLLVKINSELPSKDCGRDHTSASCSPTSSWRTVAQAFAHGSAQVLDTFAGTLDQTQCGIGQAILAVPLPQPICERHDPWIGRDHRQIGIRITTQDVESGSR